MATAANRRNRARKAAATSAAANTGTRRGRPATNDVLVRFSPAQLAAVAAIVTDALNNGAPEAPKAPDIAAIMADIGADVAPEAANVALAEVIAASMADAASYPERLAEFHAENATLNNALNALNNPKPVSRKA